MLKSIGFIFILGLLFSGICKKSKLPPLTGFIFTGLLIGPYSLNIINATVLEISPDLRQIALIIILTRAGLSLNIQDLKKVGRPAILMCFVPACFEIAGALFLGPIFFHITRIEALVLGSVLAAVSPAVIVPRMLRLIEQGYGTKKGLPQLIMASAAVDDIFVIVVFTSAIGMLQGNTLSAMNFVSILLAIITGTGLGIILGFILTKLFKNFHMRDSIKTVLFLGISFLLAAYEKEIEGFIPFSGLIAVMAVAGAINEFYPVLAKRLSAIYDKLWVYAEILLFVLVGAAIDIEYAKSELLLCVVFIIGLLLCRVTGVFVCLIQTGFAGKEKLFCMTAYLPKATVQAAISGIPLSYGFSCGNLVLTVAVISILLTAPIGAFIIDHTYRKLLSKD